MINSEDIKKIKEITEEFFQKTTILDKIEIVSVKNQDVPEKKQTSNEVEDFQKDIGTVVMDIKIDTPEILIGGKGGTLIEIQHLLKIILNKKIGRTFYVDLDINDYKKKKVEYLKSLAKDLADEVSLTKKKKILFPMPSYERRIIHLELADRGDVVTESQGEGLDRKVIIKPR